MKRKLFYVSMINIFGRTVKNVIIYLVKQYGLFMKRCERLKTTLAYEQAHS